jgi:uncharacterized membrane protein YraQ (UPF0718 family)/copper chaperone CopZ
VLEFVHEFWLVLAEMSPYLIFGFLVAGLLAAWVPADLIERHLGGHGIWPVTKASLLGIPLPICSCGVIPVAASLRQHGASRGATTSFLLSTPQTGVDSILVTLGMLGPLFAIYRPIAALITGVVGGSLVDAVERNNVIESGNFVATCTDDCCATEKGISPLRRALEYGFVTLPRDIGNALVIGLVVAALITTLVPEGFFANNLSGIWAMLAMLAVSIPLYVCATGSVPMAAAFLAAGISPGAVLVFLVAGPATNAAAITTLWKVLGPKTTFIYVGTVIVGALAGGAVLNGLFASTGAANSIFGMFMLPSWVNNASAVVLLIMLVNAMRPRRSRGTIVEPGPGETVLTLNVQGMSCGNCVTSVERALREQKGVVKVIVNLGTGTATIVGSGLDRAQLITAVTSLGYQAKTD